MARTKNVAGKGKAVASSSSQPPAKRVREEEPAPPPWTGEGKWKPVFWKTGPLSQFPEEEQVTHYNEKMDVLANHAEAFLTERDFDEEAFRELGFTQLFEALGWEAALHVYDKRHDRVLINFIQEWMSTLTIHRGRSRKDIQLSGWLRGKEIIMSLQTLSKVANFDSKHANRYIYPDPKSLFNKVNDTSKWEEMVNFLFYPGNAKEKKLKKDKLRMRARLLHMILTHNILPRRSDMNTVRTWDVPILYALLKGRPLISFRYLAIVNIWEARERVTKAYVPYCRLITALMHNQNAIPSGYSGIPRDMSPINFETLSRFSWTITADERYYRLVHTETNQRWNVLKGGASPQGDEEEEEERRGEPIDMEEEGEINLNYTVYGNPAYQGGYPNIQLYPFGGGPFDMDQFVQNARPENYPNWPDYEQAKFDAIIAGNQQNRLDSQSIYDRGELWNRVHDMNHQMEQNARYVDDKQKRLWKQHKRGEKLTPDPPVVDFTQIPHDENRAHYPEPAVHHSRWIDPYQYRAQQEEYMQQRQQQGGQSSSSGGGVWNFKELFDTMSNMYGNPGGSYY